MISAVTGSAIGTLQTTPTSGETEWPHEGPPPEQTAWGASTIFTEPHEHVRSVQTREGKLTEEASPGQLAVQEAKIRELATRLEHVRSAQTRQGMLTEEASTRELAVHLAKIRELATRLQVVDELHTRLQQVERELEQLRMSRDFDTEEVPQDPYTKWIETNIDKLRGFPNSFVALDLERGIIASAADNNEFAAKLDAMDEEQLEKLMVFHTSLYVNG